VCEAGVSYTEPVYDCFVPSIWWEIWLGENCVFDSSKFGLIEPVRLPFRLYAFLDLGFLNLHMHNYYDIQLLRFILFNKSLHDRSQGGFFFI